MRARQFKFAALAAAFLMAEACGSSSPSAPTTLPPDPTPTNVSASVSPGGIAITGVTVFHFSGTATGNNLTYSWTFGDGSSGTGQNVDHLYMVSATFIVTLKVSNSSGSANVTINPQSLGITGDWASPVQGNGFSWHFVQNGRNFTGTDTSLRPSGHTVKGILTDPRAVTFEEGGFDYVFNGTVEKGLNSMDLTYASPDGPQNVRLVRQ
jgi:hypothetical protein